MSKRLIRIIFFCGLSLLMLAPLHNVRASRWLVTKPQTTADFAGQLTTQHDTWNRMTTINVFSGQQVFFETTHIRIQTNGLYTINVTANGFAPAINTYGGIFFPATPQVNFWDNGVVGSSQQVFFAGGQQFDIVISTALAGQAGTYSVTISGPGPITVDPPPPLGILSNPLDTTITPGQTATLQVATQGRPPKTFQWFQGITGDTSNPVSGATASIFTTPALFADTSYWVRVSSANRTVDSGTATIFVTNGPISYSSALTQCDDRYNRLVPRNGPGDPVQLSGQFVSFKLFRFRVSTPGSYRFQLNTSGFNGVMFLYQGIFLPTAANVNFFGNSPVGNSVSLTQTLLADGNVMHLVIAQLTPADIGTFTLTVTNGPALVTKLPAPVITTQPGNVSLTRGQIASFNVGTNSSNVNFQWFSGACPNRTVIPGAVAASYITPPQTRDQTYTVRLENPGGYEISVPATVTILPTAGNINADAIVQNTSLSIVSPGLLRSATAGDGRILTAHKVSDPTHGTVNINSLGGFTYQPAINYSGPDSFTYRVFDGVNFSNTATVNLTVVPIFANNTPFTIPSSGPASTYPSTINVSGLSGTISRMRVKLNMLRHESQGDLDILLVGPQGQALILMSDANGDLDNPFLFDRVLTFEDAATGTIFDGQALFDGTYRPVNYGGGDSFPSPAPATFSSPAPAGTATLASVFNGTDPNGAWKLFIFDDQGGSSGSLPGWSLTIFTTGVGCPSFTITPASLPEALLNAPFPTTTLQASGGSGLYTFQITAGALPSGMSFTPEGVLSGTPTQAGLFTFTVTAKDQNNCTWQRVYTLNIACPVISISPSTLPAGAINQPYSATLESDGGRGPYRFSKLTGTLPNGVTLNANGTFNGLPLQPGSFGFTVQAIDANGCAGTQDFILQVNCQPITVSAPANNTASVNAPFSAQFTQTGGIGTTTFSTTSTLPDGLTLVGSGTLSGTPTQTGSFPLLVKATDSNGCFGMVSYTLTIACPQLGISPATLPAATRGAAYSQLLTAANALGTTTFAITGGALPNGLTLSPAGLLGGAPTMTGSFTFTVTVTDSRTCGGSQTYTLVVNCPVLSLAPASLPGGQAGIAYNQQLSANGVAPQSFTVTGGNLPTGLMLTGNGLLTGTPAATGNFSFTIQAADAQSCTGTQSYAINFLCPAITLGSGALPDGQAGTPYSASLNAMPAVGVYTFAVTNGMLPPGLTLQAGGGLSGTPVQTGTFNFRITAAGFGGQCSGFRDYQLLISGCAPITLNPASLPNGTVGSGYIATVSASPSGAYSFAVTSGTLPMGLTLNAASGAITGLPTMPGTFSFRITASAGGCSGFRDYTLIVACSTITLSATLPNGSAGAGYNQAIGAMPAGTYSFSLIAGGLPAGLILNTSTGVLSGLAMTSGTFNFTIKAQTTTGCAGTQQYSLVINCPAIALSSLAGPSLGTAYNQTVTVTPSGGNYSFAIGAGTLPTGLSLNAATGLVSGTPSQAGTFNFTITAIGFGACTGSRAYGFTLGGGGCPTITLPDLPNGVPAQLYSNSVVASPAGNYNYAVTMGSLPPGLTLFGSFGLLFGYPTTAGTYNFTITATDANNCTGNKSYSMVIGGVALQSLVFGDFDGDGKADLSVWRGQDGNWLTVNSGDGQLKTESWGSTAAPYYDVMTPGDYDGDGKMDLAVFRRGIQNGQGGEWLIKGSKDGAMTAKVWGLATDVPVPGDYDGDGKTDIAVWRGAETNWYILLSGRSSDGQTQTVSWGTSQAPYRDVPVPADFDGDGKTDVAVFRQSNGHWYIKLSSNGSTLDKAWGLGTDIPVAADYDGDGKADIAVWRGAETNWYILLSGRSSDGAAQSISWGTASLGDVPVPGDYDGDGKADVAIWRASEGRWYAQLSRDTSVLTRVHGQSGDSPALGKSRP